MSRDPRPIRRLVLIFNADSGTLNAIFDSARKLLGSSECSLCSITHGLAGEKPAWRRYRSRLGFPVDYLHRDELDADTRVLAGELPVVVAVSDEGWEVLLERGVLDRCRGSVAEFVRKLEKEATRRGLRLGKS